MGQRGQNGPDGLGGQGRPSRRIQAVGSGKPGVKHAASSAEKRPEPPELAATTKHEARLIKAACSGDPPAIEDLYRAHYDPIYRYVVFRVGAATVAEDITSQVFLGMCRGLPRYVDEGKPFIAWLYGIAQKQVAFHQRTQNRRPSLVDLDTAQQLMAATAGPEATAEEKERRLNLARALALLPESQREVILLRYVLSLSLAETASATGRTEGAVKQVQLRGLASLQGLLGREGVELA